MERTETCVLWKSSRSWAVGERQDKFATGLYTGCCYSRKLTACIIPVNAKEDYELPTGDKKEELTSRY
ncbi:hypothetical protein PsorP6_004769 [Peronosclerospora sorghi]|uniref:Uncharacterized protein n=1 Tax=Peronosclerospora sorghi TaxID=230839 RepID=A0ACC0VRL1_9STRA|nr:hypothetical protein PsorP6_004769 [Peronosclerospora sorghi]